MQHQRSVHSKRSRSRGGLRNRSGSSLGGGGSSFDPSDYGDNPDSSDEDGEGGKVARRRSFKAMSTRSELSFDPSVFAGDFDDDEFEGVEDDECGIGASLRAGDDGRAVVIGLVNGGPALRSGVLNVGDVVVRIDGVDAASRTHSELVDMVSRPEPAPRTRPPRAHPADKRPPNTLPKTPRNPPPQNASEFAPENSCGSDPSARAQAVWSAALQCCGLWSVVCCLVG